ncbi:hypothetical protein P389DRAFT_110233 [Cystobasidium minutum MCA 4210]|uniref:uncharacterized protein n=1 Tax=Cystobasidium minutum MCA 4210 TaxID=1397322 RepID=UPI0034CD2417|eukprot:jgi/Rhomi1/110233/CE110232_82
MKSCFVLLRPKVNKLPSSPICRPRLTWRQFSLHQCKSGVSDLRRRKEKTLIKHAFSTFSRCSVTGFTIFSGVYCERADRLQNNLLLLPEPHLPKSRFRSWQCRF